MASSVTLRNLLEIQKRSVSGLAYAHTHTHTQKHLFFC